MALGAGLGLAICLQFIELMGGKIGLISSTEHGSTFHFDLTFPVVQQPEKAPPTAPASLPAVRARVKVLLVEDNRVNQKVAEALLRKVGRHVVAVENGQDALQHIHQEPYDLVLMDCQMPVMDGFEAAKQIRAMPAPLCNIPIIALTAHAMSDDRQKCLEGGMDDYLSKPISRSALITLVQKHAD